jgi:hypothetical protein
MTKRLTILALLAILSAGVARADDDCSVPMADWQPREAVAQLAAGKGWTVRRIKIDDGCYEIDGADAQGRRIEVKVHPGTLDVIGIEYDDED